MQLPGAPAGVAVAGVLGPSRDRAGRGYPAAVVATLALEDAAAHPEVLPVLLEDHWQGAVEAFIVARTTPLAPGDGRLALVTGAPLGDGAAALEVYLAWTRRTTPGEFCAALDRPADWLEHALERVSSTVRPGRDRPPRARMLRVPLGQAAGGAMCFWLDVVRRSAGRGRSPSFFWSHDERTGEAFISVDDLQDTTLATLWSSSGSSSGSSPAPGWGAVEVTCDLTQPIAPAPAGELGLWSLGDGEAGTLAKLLELVG
jgi:hypothetical protein